MFIDRQRAALIEAAEGRLCAAVAATVPGHRITPIGGGVSVFGRPGSPVNKIVGLGFDGLPAESELAELEARGESRVELSTLADPEVGRMLSRLGYHLEGFENVLGIALPAAPRGATSVVEVEVTEDPAWFDLTVEGFIHADETSEHAETFPREIVEEVMIDLSRAAGFVRYLARIGGEPAGTASMRMEGEVAMFTGATTLPRFRRRGTQGKLLAVRLAAAAAAGCTLGVITTAPGTRSQENSHRQGFSILYARAVLVKPGPEPRIS